MTRSQNGLLEADTLQFTHSKLIVEAAADLQVAAHMEVTTTADWRLKVIGRAFIISDSRADEDYQVLPLLMNYFR